MWHIFLSPHFDDVVASCGGLIAKLIYEQEEVLVYTIFTHSPNIFFLPKRLHKFTNYQTRVEEDQNALSKLGVDSRHMGLLENAFHPPFFKRPTDVFRLKLKKGLEQFPNLERIWEELENITEEFPKSQIYVPLGIGNHFDHIEVFLAALMYMVDHQDYERFLFYIDFYGMISTKIRKKHYLGLKIIKKGFQKPEKTSLRFFFFSFFLSLIIKGANINKLLDEKYTNLHWSLKQENITGYEKLKLLALEEYKSQVKLFGENALKKALNTFHTNWDHSELYFQAKPKGKRK
ncbi:MAG: PIG-L deacetylase family protein [Candidatus Heimdallarchaeaceae archaeon]